MKGYSLSLPRYSLPGKLILLSLLCACSPARAELKIAGPLSVPAGKLVRLAAEGQNPKAGLVWRVYPRGGIDRADTARHLFQGAGAPGVYDVELLAIRLAADGSTTVEEAAVRVTIGDAPTPPDPPQPPIPPPPSDPLYKILAALYAADPTPERPKRRDELAAGYDQAALTAADASLTTAGQLRQRIQAGFDRLLPREALRNVRDAIGAELNQHLPKSADTPLDAAIRKTAAEQFGRIAALVRALK